MSSKQSFSLSPPFPLTLLQFGSDCDLSNVARDEERYGMLLTGTKGATEQKELFRDNSRLPAATEGEMEQDGLCLAVLEQDEGDRDGAVE